MTNVGFLDLTYLVLELEVLISISTLRKAKKSLPTIHDKLKVVYALLHLYLNCQAVKIYQQLLDNEKFPLVCTLQ